MHYHWWNGLRGPVFIAKATYRADTCMCDPRQNGHSLRGLPVCTTNAGIVMVCRYVHRWIGHSLRGVLV